MASFLVVYGTGADRTRAAVDHLCETLADRGHETTDAEAAVFPANVSLDGFDAVVVAATGAPGGPEDGVEEFAERYRAELMDAPTALVQCWPPTPVVDPADRARAAAQLEELFTETAWYPDRIAGLEGPLAYSRHGFLRLLDLQRSAEAAEGNGRDADADEWSVVFETVGDADDREGAVDEGAVAAIAADVAAFVEGRLGTAPPAAERPGDEEGT